MKLINDHQQLKLRGLKSQRLDSGFAMMEVVLGIVMVTFFTGIAMQGMVVASLLKSRAQQYSEAIAWIQEDLENIKYQATIYKSTSLTSAATLGTSAIAVASAQDFEVNDKLKIGADNTSYTVSSISGNTLTISPSLTVDLSAGSPVVANQSIRCGTSTSPATITTGFADAFRDKITGSVLSATTNNYDITKTSSSNSGKQFRVRRSTTLADVAPYNVVQVNYTVSEINGSSSFSLPIADLSAELVPTTSFLCP